MKIILKNKKNGTFCPFIELKITLLLVFAFDFKGTIQIEQFVNLTSILYDHKTQTIKYYFDIS